MAPRPGRAFLFAAQLAVVGVAVSPSTAPSSGWNASAAILEFAQGLDLAPRYCTSPKVHWDIGHQHVLAECAALQAQLWVLGGSTDDALAEGAVDSLATLAAQANVTREADFFTSHPMMLAYTMLQPAGRLSVQQVAAVRAFVAKAFRTQTPASNNQHYQRAAGLALAAQTFPTLPLAKKWMAYSEAVWALVEKCGDITEDAPNYNRIDLTFLWVLSDLLGKSKQLSTQLFRAGMFARFAAQVSPLGVIPSYGDSGGSHPTTAANFSDNPWSNPCWGFVAGFIRAAAEFTDAGLAATAQALFVGGMASQPLGGAYGDVSDAYRLLFGVRWGLLAPAPAEAPPPFSSAVLTRRDENGPHVPDKIVMRGGGASASSPASFLLSDLYGTELPVPPHAHENQHGQVNYFEHGGVPLVSSLGYDNRGPADTNLLLVRSVVDGEAVANASFPHLVPDFEANTWEHSVLPTKRIGTGNLQSDPVSIKGVTLRIEWDGKPIEFSAAAMALNGPNGSQPLELFTNCSLWRQEAGINCTQTMENLPDGGSVPALVWSFPGSGKGGQAGAQFISMVQPPELTFDAAVFPELHVDFRFSRTFDDSRSFILRLESSPNAVDFHAAVLNLAPALVSASVDNAVAITASGTSAGNDSLATMSYSSWFSFDISHNRTMLLAGPEGVLLVRDTIDLGATAAKNHFRAGPIWHFGPVVQPVISQTGQPWVLSQNASINLCVAFASISWTGSGLANDLHVGAQTAAVWSKKQQQTAFASASLREAGVYTFVSLLVPVHASDLGEAALRSFDTKIEQSGEAGGDVTATVVWSKSECHGGGGWCGTQLKMTIASGPSYTKTVCSRQLALLCDGVRRASTGNCLICAGQHQLQLSKAQCSNLTIDAWCSSSGDNDAWKVERTLLDQ